MESQQHEYEHSEGHRCVICGRFFQPARRGGRQKTCLDPPCQKKRKRWQEQEWIKQYKDKQGASYFAGDYERIRTWREKRPDYQAQWRARRRAAMRRALKDCSAEIHNAQVSGNSVTALQLRLRIPSTLRLSEIQTLNLRLTRSESGFWVDGYP